MINCRSELGEIDIVGNVELVNSFLIALNCFCCKHLRLFLLHFSYLSFVAQIIKQTKGMKRFLKIALFKIEKHLGKKINAKI